MRPDAKFCPYCGTEVEPANKSEDTAAAGEKEGGRDMKRVISMLLAIILTLSLSVSAMAATKAQNALEIEITWMNLDSQPIRYIPELDWLVLLDGGVVERSTGKQIAEDYIEAYNFSEGLAVVTDGYGKRGFIDRTGTVVVPLEYDDVGSSGAIVWVKKGMSYGIFENPCYTPNEMGNAAVGGSGIMPIVIVVCIATATAVVALKKKKPAQEDTGAK